MTFIDVALLLVVAATIVIIIGSLIHYILIERDYKREMKDD